MGGGAELLGGAERRTVSVTWQLSFPIDAPCLELEARHLVEIAVYSIKSEIVKI